VWIPFSKTCLSLDESVTRLAFHGNDDFIHDLEGFLDMFGILGSVTINVRIGTTKLTQLGTNGLGILIALLDEGGALHGRFSSTFFGTVGRRGIIIHGVDQV